MNKKIKSILLALTMLATMISTNVGVFADTPGTTQNEIIVTTIINEATMDPNVRMPRNGNPRVVSSWVQLGTIDWWWFWATGSVTVRDNGRDFFHYTRAELWARGSLLVRDENRWGWSGFPGSTTPRFNALGNGFTERELTPRIFFGW